MKKILLALISLLFLIGCNGNQPTPQKNTSKQIEAKEEYERTVSYRDIIMKINDINTNKKTNKRVKNIIKEYQYNVSDDDSKNSARKKALTQVKILILEEIGVFVESYLELSTVVENEKYQKHFKEEIKNLTAGIIKIKIIDEKFDGKSYYVKASVLVDPDSVSEGISEILKIKANKSEISKLQKLLQSKEQEIDMRSSETITLQKKITKQEFINRAKEEELKEIQLKLQKTQQQLKQFKREEIYLNTEIGRVQSKVQKAMQRIKNQSQIACLMKIGMTRDEVRSIIGDPAGSDTYDIYWYYGGVTLKFKQIAGILTNKSGCNE